MTLTTTVRINWPVPAERLLKDMTIIAAKGTTWEGRESEVPTHASEYRDRMPHNLSNQLGIGLNSLMWVEWGEMPNFGYMDEEDLEDNCPQPEACVIFSMDNPYACADMQLPIAEALWEWLNEQGVPRDRWYWNRESAGTWHPGTWNPAVWMMNDHDIDTWVAP